MSNDFNYFENLSRIKNLIDELIESDLSEKCKIDCLCIHLQTLKIYRGKKLKLGDVELINCCEKIINNYLGKDVDNVKKKCTII